MPSSRLKQSSTTRRPIGIDGLRAASVRSSTGFARAIFSVLGTIAISALTYGAARLYLKPSLVNTAKQSPKLKALIGDAGPAVARPAIGLKVNQRGSAGRPVGTDSLPRSRTPSLAELPLGMENLKREQFPSAHPKYISASPRCCVLA